MALVGEMPGHVRSRSFDLGHAQQLTPAGEVGFIQTINRTAPFWVAEYETAALDDTQYGEWTTFLDSLEGSMNSFLAHDPRRPMPLAYKNASTATDPWTAVGQPNAIVTDYDYANSALGLTQLDDAAIISPGDYMSFTYLGVWYLYRVQWAGAISGGACVVSVKPRPTVIGAPPGPSWEAPLRYRRACVEMKMIGRPEEMDAEVGGLPRFKFKAAQYTARAPT